MGIFDKIKDALGNNQHESAPAAPTTNDVPFDPTLDLPQSDSAQGTAPADSETTVDAPAPTADPVLEGQENAAGAEIGSIFGGQSSERTMEPADTQPAPEPAVEQQPAAPAPVEPQQQAPAQETYTVVEGDNLTWIGERYGVSVDDLVAANNIENPDLIFPGQVLTIPR